MSRKLTSKGVSGDEERVTVRDVAARAGVSATTVSRVIKGDYPVAQSTKTRVLRAMRELDYVLNVHARALSGASTKMVAFVLDDVTGPSFAYVAMGVEQQATAEGRLCKPMGTRRANWPSWRPCASSGPTPSSWSEAAPSTTHTSNA